MRQFAIVGATQMATEAPTFVPKLSGLTAGDTATVARKAAALDEREPRMLASARRGETRSCAAKDRLLILTHIVMLRPNFR
jgi:hypothetical protein